MKHPFDWLKATQVRCQDCNGFIFTSYSLDLNQLTIYGNHGCPESELELKRVD